MTRVAKNTERKFRLQEGGYTRRLNIQCDLFRIGGRAELWISGLRVSPAQCRKLIDWLERAHQLMVGEEE